MSGATQSRQKSCVPCAKSKRKCDQGNPVCSRCAEKFLFCEYKTDAGTHRNDGSGKEDSLMTYMPELETQNGLVFPSLSDIIHQDDIITDISEDLRVLNPASFEEFFFGAYDGLMQTHTYPDEIGTMDRERIRYCVRHLQSYPEKLFRFGKTPFIHPRCYSPILPIPLQEACCAASLYVGKTEANEAMVWDIITTKANRLMVPQMSWSISEQLAYVQALIIFQVIRLFDGDIRQRSDAEKHEETLILWTDQLASRTGANTGAMDVVPSRWESWVFQESICRTIIVSRMVQAMFSIQKKGFCTLVAGVTELSFTAQKALWEAPSAHHWQRDIRERSALYCPRMVFTEVLATATANDIDELGLLMLVTYKGVDGVNDWISRTGGVALIE